MPRRADGPEPYGTDAESNDVVAEEAVATPAGGGADDGNAAVDHAGVVPIKVLEMRGGAVAAAVAAAAVDGGGAAFKRIDDAVTLAGDSVNEGATGM